MINKLSALVLLGLAATVSTAFATPVCPDGSSMSTFLASGYSCQIGDKIFSNFSYVSSAFCGRWRFRRPQV